MNPKANPAACIQGAAVAALISLIFSFTASAQSRTDAPDSAVSYGVSGFMPAFYTQMKSSLTWPMAWEHSGYRDFCLWKDTARNIVLECLENIPPAPASFDMEIAASEQREGYTALKIQFNVSEWCRVPAYLLVPEGDGPFPAVLMLHDHGAHFTIGKEKLIRPFGVSDRIMEDAEAWTEKCYDGVFIGDYFARNGFVVLAVDALFWGKRGRLEGADYDVQQALASNLLQMGGSWGGIITADDMRSADFLASLDCVDPARTGCLGFSMGAYRSWMLAAVSEQIAVSASVCWMNTTEYLMTMSNNQNKGGSAYSMIVPGLRRYMDYPHTAVLACPRPALFFNGSRDKLFPVEGVKDAYTVLRQAWKDNGASDRLVTKIWDETHFFNRQMQEETLVFFQKWL